MFQYSTSSLVGSYCKVLTTLNTVKTNKKYIYTLVHCWYLVHILHPPKGRPCTQGLRAPPLEETPPLRLRQGCNFNVSPPIIVIPTAKTTPEKKYPRQTRCRKERIARINAKVTRGGMITEPKQKDVTTINTIYTVTYDTARSGRLARTSLPFVF